MYKLLIGAIAALCLTFGAVAPANAHNFDANSFWACGATRPSNSYIVDHSHPVLFTSQQIDYGCAAHSATGWCYHWFATVWLTLPGNPITGHDYSSHAC
jgi:hypothetical protein